MKKLLLLFVALFATQVSAQKWVDFQDFTVKNVPTDSGKVVALSENNEVITGPKRMIDGKYRNPFIWYGQFKKDGDVKIQFSIGYTNYGYDNSSRDLNYVSIDVIPDGIKSKMITFEGKVYNESGFIKILNKSKNSGDFYDLLRSSNDIYVRLRVGDKVGSIYRFSARGFTKADAFAESVLSQTSNNPFNSNNNTRNPFQG